MRKIFEADFQAQDPNLEILTLCCKEYLFMDDGKFKDLTYTGLKMKIYSQDNRFYLNSRQFDFKFNAIEYELSNMILDNFNLDDAKKQIFLNFCYLLCELTALFHLKYHGLFEKHLFPALENRRVLFEWSMDAMARISNSSISLPFYDESISPFPLYYPEVQLISGFIITLFKVVQAVHKNKHYNYDIFFITQCSFTELSIQSLLADGNVLRNSPVEILTNLFLEFLNKVIKKRNELKKFEEQTKDACCFERMMPAVNEFFESLIKIFMNDFELCEN